MRIARVEAAVVARRAAAAVPARDVHARLLVTHFFDPMTGLNVILRGGIFVSGRRLTSNQLANFLRNGSPGCG